MPHITPDMLETEELLFYGIEAVAQRWHQNFSRFSYEKNPRPNAGLFILCADLKATVRPQSGDAFVIGQGGILLLPKGAFYNITFEGDFAQATPHSYVVNFNPFTKDGEQVTFGNAPLLLVENGSLEKLPLSALNRAVHDVPRQQLKVRSLFFQVMEGVFDMAREQDAVFYPIRRGVKLLRREWKENEKISRYAAACGVSESYFHALFKGWAGMTPVEYRNRLRLSYACSYLKNTADKVEDIARQVGFDDPFYFSRLFKKIIGMTPREYRRT